MDLAQLVEQSNVNLGYFISYIVKGRWFESTNPYESFQWAIFKPDWFIVLIDCSG